MQPKPKMNLQAMARHIELWLLDRLIPFARNPRTHSDAQIAQIAASIAEFGFNNPILVDTKAGIIAGHGRLLAARKLGLTEVPVIVLDHLSEAQRRAYVIADNKLAENAGWDDELLRSELAALQEEGFDISAIGFEDDELARLLAAPDAVEGLTDEDAVPALPETSVNVTSSPSNLPTEVPPLVLARRSAYPEYWTEVSFSKLSGPSRLITPQHQARFFASLTGLLAGPAKFPAKLPLVNVDGLRGRLALAPIMVETGQAGQFGEHLLVDQLMAAVGRGLLRKDRHACVA